MPAYDALVVGGGPAGATAGIILAKSGWRVAIVEKSEFPRRKVCGEFISAPTLPLLRELGVDEEFVRLAGPEVHNVGLFHHNTCLTAPMSPADRATKNWGRALGREHLDLLLLSAAAGAGASIWQPWRAVELVRGDSGWVCTIAWEGAREEVSAPVIVAANGSWERGPFADTDTRAHRPGDLLAFKAHFRDCNLTDGLMPLLVFPGGYGGMVHTDHGRVSLSCCVRRDRLSALRGESQGRAAEAILRHIQNSCAGVRDALRRGVLEGGWLSAGPIRPGIRPRYSDGIFFLGNSAGEAHPIIAEGISMAIQSAWLLCRQLVAWGDSSPDGSRAGDIGKVYASEWQDAFALRIRSAAFFAHLAMRPGIAGAVAPVLGLLPQLLSVGARLAGKAQSLRPLNRNAGDPGSLSGSQS